MFKATYVVPFTASDFDYESMAKACGCTRVGHYGYILMVEGTMAAIDSLSADLSFKPQQIYWKPQGTHDGR